MSSAFASGDTRGRIRLGLCCQFRREPIRFRTTTAAALRRWPRHEQLARLSDLCRWNAEALGQALQFCVRHGIGAFRILSQILPLKTHPQLGYRVEELPHAVTIVEQFRQCGAYARKHGLRLTFHPDQFVLLNSPSPTIHAHAMAELEYHAQVAEWVGADVITLHGGGAYGDKSAALQRLLRRMEKLPSGVLQRLALENDDRVFTPSDLLPVCREAQIPFVYDVHHHRCLPDGLKVEKVTELMLQTWHREPLCHISSPLNGWEGPHPERHHAYIDPADFPKAWLPLRLTVEVEAKAKELAVLRLLDWLRCRVPVRSPNGRQRRDH